MGGLPPPPTLCDLLLCNCMSDPIIRVENLSKKYILSHQDKERYSTLRDAIAHRLKTFCQSPRSHFQPQSPQQEDFWALKDVSFEIQRGDRVGIIGRNGAGKSTLLKILSRITEPTSGRIEINGRVASLLEVGTGFHPELTGRENIFLNGAILGMSKFEIQRKFDEIVAFAEVEKFLDTPVKRYSSGMYVRLAFAVAAHLEPEILIVDEVLAVGDAQFQKKCLGKMGSVAQAGRTILFVSHDMSAIRQLCSKAILLNQGRSVIQGETDEVMLKYLQSSEPSMACLKVNKYGIILDEISFEDSKTGLTTEIIFFNCDYKLKLKVSSLQTYTSAGIVVKIYNSLGILVSSICSPEEGLPLFTLEGTIEVDFLLSQIQLLPGQYRISVYIHRSFDPEIYFSAEDILSFEIESATLSNATYAYRKDHGITRIAKGGEIRGLQYSY